MNFHAHWRAELRATVLLALPIVFGQAGQMLMGLTDSVIVGRLGPVPLAAVAFANTALTTLMVFGIGLLTSIGVVGSREHGAGNLNGRARILRAAFWLSVSLGTCLAIAINALQGCLGDWFHPPADVFEAAQPYLSVTGWSLLPAIGYFGAKIFCESLNCPLAPMWFLFGGVMLNLILASALVFGWFGFPALGLVGSGWATAISRWFTFAATTWYACSLTGESWRRTLLPAGLDQGLLGRLLRLGAPVAFQYLGEVAAFNFGAVMMGWIGTIALAAHQIAISCAALTFMFPLGVSQAVAVRIGHAVGGRALRRVPVIGFTGIGLSAALMLAFAGILGFGRHAIALAFNADPAVVSLAGRLLLIAALFQLADGVQVTAAGVLRGLADVRAPMLLGYLFYWVVAIPLASLIAFHFGQGASGIWIGLATGLLLAAVTLTGRAFALTRPGSLSVRAYQAGTAGPEDRARNSAPV
ncbi:MAG: MATE family efflux transporter [Verrucomicrobia bacterium]|nr:MATE family efflux transporter [Verrucomicrobiota bacterium]